MIKELISEFKKDIEYYLDVEELDIDDIDPMRYPEGEEDKRANFVNPFAKYNSRDSRIKYKRH